MNENKLEIAIKRLDAGLSMPEYAYPGDAGCDLRSADERRITCGERAVVATGVAVAIPEGYAGLVLPRSGLAARHGVGVVNGPGLIDAHYRGEIKVILINHDRYKDFVIRRGDRIAQLVIIPVAKVRFVEKDDLEETRRGANGFGSSGQ